MQLAALQKDLGQQRAAVGIYEGILEKTPANADALREAARLYSELDMPLRAIFCWQRRLSLKPGDLEGQSRPAAVYKKVGAEDPSLTALFINMQGMGIFVVGTVGVIVAPFLGERPQLMFVILGCAILWSISYVLPMKDTR